MTKIVFTLIEASKRFGILLVALCDTDVLPALIDWLSQRRECSRVFSVMKAVKANKWVRGIVQNHNLNPDYVSRSGLLSWDHGLDGAGQIIGVGDTGIDTESCFFGKVPIQITSPPIMPHHFQVP